MTKAEEIFNIKAEYNKWLKELTDDEKELVLEMINEALLIHNVSEPVCELCNGTEIFNPFDGMELPCPCSMNTVEQTVR